MPIKRLPIYGRNSDLSTQIVLLRAIVGTNPPGKTNKSANKSIQSLVDIWRIMPGK
jgi:hypothetical protein